MSMPDRGLAAGSVVLTKEVRTDPTPLSDLVVFMVD